jgi:hypothetical protein
MKFKMGGSGIHIKPENKGKFTATKKATGKSTEELTHSKNPVTKKRAVFAQNAAKFKHADGSKNVMPAKKMAMGTKSTKSFPDLNKDGKITQADILKGRGVIKNGSKSMKVDEKMCGSKGMKYAEGTKSIKFKKKPMMKRADGSTSQRGLYDNIRANKGSGKKPTPEMLKQEKKIKSGK